MGQVLCVSLQTIFECVLPASLALERHTNIVTSSCSTFVHALNDGLRCKGCSGARHRLTVVDTVHPKDRADHFTPDLRHHGCYRVRDRSRR
jgi:hypothetical protein